MAVLPVFRRAFHRTKTDNSDTISAVEESKRDPVADDVAVNTGNDEHQAVLPSEDLQDGVRDAEAMTLTWSRPMLLAVFINIWLLYFVNAFQSSICSNLTPYVTSAFESHSLLNVIYIVADSVSAACYIPLAKIMDVWGRAEGFLFMAVVATLGLVLMAICNNLATFCAAYVFWTLGFSGMTYCVDVITADVSRLKNRGLAYAFTSSPYIITAFAGAKASEKFYYQISWRWAFGCFAIIFPIVAAPLYFVLKFNVRKAQKEGVLVREKSGRTILQSIWYYTIEFDLPGVILFSAGLTVFFLPFDIASAAPDGWATGYIIAMLVVGFVMLWVFAAYETFLAPLPMFNLTLLSNRTVIGACLLDATYQLSYYCWDNYFTSFLRVVNNLSIAEAGYVNNTFDVVSGVLLLGVGAAIRVTGRFKWTLYIAVPTYVLAQGLMIYFRRPDQSIGYIVMCQIFISIGGSIFIIVQQIAILAAVDHQHVAGVLALLNVVGTVGDSAGATICGAIWSNTFEKALKRYLPASALPQLAVIYEKVPKQVKYPMGSPTRIAIQKAYAYSQTRMLAVGTGIIGLAFVWMLLIRNIDLKRVTQVKGTVF